MSAKGDKQVELRKYISTQMGHKRLSQKDFAEKLKRDPSTISNWLNGNYQIPLDALDEIADTLEEPTPIRLYHLAGMFSSHPAVNSLFEMLSDATPDELDLVGRITRTLRKNENQ